MTRLMVDAAEFVCSVPKVKWPVSAIRRADSMVSKSRISPIRTTSGSWRRAARKRIGKSVRVGMHFALVHQAAFVSM